MEPTKAKMRLFLGEYPVVEVLGYGAFRVALGPGTAITIHVGDFPHQVKKGDKVPLFTEVPYAETISTSIQ